MSVELYDSQHPQAAKWLLPDGTVTYKLPISGAGGGGTDNHALLDNLGYAESGHIGFASQAALEQIAAKAPDTSTLIFHEFSPGLRIYRVAYGNVYHYWIEGEASEPRSHAEGTYIATPTQFPELAQFQGGRLVIFAFAYRFSTEIGGTVYFEFVAFTLTKKGITITPIMGTHFNCIDADMGHGGTNIAFTTTLILGTPN